MKVDLVGLSTVDSSQGSQKPIVIVDMVTLAARKFADGFVFDIRRLTVGLSRAMHGLVLVVYERMAQTADQAWGKAMCDGIIEYCAVRRQLRRADGPTGWQSYIGDDVRLRYEVCSLRRYDYPSVLGTDTSGFESHNLEELVNIGEDGKGMREGSE